MIYLNYTAATNSVVVTLQENSDIWVTSGILPTYLFSFISDTTQEVINFLPTQITTASTITSRYNEFTFNQAIVSAFTPIEFWTYEIREQLSTTNLEPTLAGKLVETGKVQVLGVDEIQNVFYTPTGNTTYIVYNNY